MKSQAYRCLADLEIRTLMRYFTRLLLMLSGLMPVTAYSQTALPPSVRMRLGSDAEIVPAYQNADCSVRVFAKDGGGFAIVCGDRIVGYSDAADFDISSMPPALLEIIENVGLSKTAKANGALALTPAAPLLGEMAWDQNAPYNLLCPAYYGTQISATGCAATAMAQIMRYHCWPKVGIGSHSYTPERYAVIGELSVDFSKSIYDWDNMLLRYDEKATEEQQYAVARLMYDAGVAVSMDYGPESGTMSDRWPRKLVEHFGYDEGVAIRYRSNYDVEEWNSVIRREIDEGRPVFVTGFTELGGHAFVFDGYDENGMVHVNWGWSGMSNGYFDTEWLTPSTQGTGGSNGGFNSRQLIVTNIRPPHDGAEKTVCLISEEGLTSSLRKVKSGESTALKLNGKVENVGWCEVSVDFGVMLADCNGEPIAIFEGEKGVELAQGGQHRNLSFGSVELPQMEEGRRYLYPVAKCSDGLQWERIRDKDLDFPNYLIVETAQDGSSTIDVPEMASLSLISLTPSSRFFSSAKGLAKVEIENNGGTEYKGNVSLTLCDLTTGKKLTAGDAFLIDLMPGQSTVMDLTASFYAEAGKYLLALIDRSGNKVGQPVEIELGAELRSEVKAVAAPHFGDNDNVDPMDMHAVVEVASSDDAQFSGYLFLYFYNADTSEVVGCLGPEYVQVVGDTSATVRFHGAFENAVPGAFYDVKLVDGEGFTYVKPAETAVTRIRMSGEAGVEGVAPDESDDPRYFNLQGQPLGSRPSGICIELRGGKAVKKIMN